VAAAIFFYFAGDSGRMTSSADASRARRIRTSQMTIPSSVHDGQDLPAGIKVEKQPIERATARRFAGGEVALSEYSREDQSRLDLNPKPNKPSV
jgi:hypothetical protein